MTLQEFVETLTRHPQRIGFQDTMAQVEALYSFVPTAFKNGDTYNDAGQNNGSCKLFAFARLQGFDEQQTLQCFGDYYRVDVLQNPAGNDHQNIRNFMKYGWSGITFEDEALRGK